jgi:arginyl-tRNA synthetase
MDNITEPLNQVVLSLQEKYGIKSIKCDASDHGDFQISVTAIVKSKRGTCEEIINLVKLNDQFNGIFEFTIDETNNNYFANINFKRNYIMSKLDLLLSANKLYEQSNESVKVLFDYASPNIAKEMHIGHLRSMVIGDAIANLYKYLNYSVLRINHIGDFGLQIGYIINYIKKNNLEYRVIQSKTINLQKIYRLAKQQFEEDGEFERTSYETVKDLHLNNNQNLQDLWSCLRQISLDSYAQIFNLMNVKQDIIGESFYKKYISEFLEKIKDKTHLVEGRTIMKSDVEKVPFTLVKSDGAYTYDTTDLVALYFRTNYMQVNEIYYVVDSGQASHFTQLFKIGKELNLLNNVVAEHIDFGIMLGKDKKRIKSRSGDSPKLIDIIDLGVDETTKSFTERNLDDLAIMQITISSMKYADLSVNRKIDYVFNPVEMLQLKGNTYLYLSYSLVRCAHIIKAFDELTDYHPITDLNNYDYGLLNHIFKYPFILSSCVKTKFMSTMCKFLYDLANKSNVFYEKNKCIITKNSTYIVMTERLKIVRLVHKIFIEGFDILNLSIIDKI